MKIQPRCKAQRIPFLALLAILPACITVHAQKAGKNACAEPQPESLCNPENTCGSPSAPCIVDITRTGASSSVKPRIRNSKRNQLFCVKAGTDVIWMSSKENTGFMVSFGSGSPFAPDQPIVGGGKKPVTVKALTPGCYRYDAGAFYSGALYGMSGGSRPELVILP